MDYMVNKQRDRLTLYATPREIRELREMDEIQSDDSMHEFLEPLVGNTELQWISPADTGDLTDAPMLGILGEEGVRDHTVFAENFGLVVTGCNGHNTMARPILARWAFMDYQVRSVLEDLRDTGKAVFVGGDLRGKTP